MEIKKKKNKNTGLYITLTAIIIVIAAMVAVTSVVTDRSREEIVDSDVAETGDDTMEVILRDTEETEEETETKTEETAQTETEAALTEPEETKEAAETQSQNVLPTFTAPLSGAILNGHSDTVPVFSDTMNDYRTHIGVDITAEEGSAVRAPADGVVGAVYEDPLMGTCMTLVHSGGAVTTYKGLYSTLPDGITKGVSVKAGQVIAATGDTALIEVAEEPHLHFEMTVDGVAVDPCIYIPFDNQVFYED